MCSARLRVTAHCTINGGLPVAEAQKLFKVVAYKLKVLELTRGYFFSGAYSVGPAETMHTLHTAQATVNMDHKFKNFLKIVIDKKL
jgi:hypothetical protein